MAKAALTRRNQATHSLRITTSVVGEAGRVVPVVPSRRVATRAVGTIAAHFMVLLSHFALVVAVEARVTARITPWMAGRTIAPGAMMIDREGVIGYADVGPGTGAVALAALT